MTRRTATAIAVTVIVASMLVPLPSQAQERDTVTLGPLIISASKTPIDRRQLTLSVTVLTGEDLRALGVARVSDALQQVPGVAIAQNGSFGSVASLFLRGGESRYTKVLIDGVAVNQSGGYFDFSHLTTDNIDRIEIVRGPASVLYGADAITGVIQIFTRQGKGPLSIDASGRAGTYGTREGNVSLSGARSGVSYTVAGAQHKSNGVYDFNNEYSNGTLSGSLGVAPSPAFVARVNARYTNAEFHYPTDYTGAPVDSNSYRVQHRFTLGGLAAKTFAPSFAARLLAGTNEVSDLTEDIAAPFGSPDPLHLADKSRAYRRSVEAHLDLLSPAAANLNIGGELVWEGEKSTSLSGPVGASATPTSTFDARRQTRGVFAELLGSPERRIAYTVALRLDDNSDYGSHTTYRLGVRIPIFSDIRVRGSLSTAFNAPAFNQIRPTLFTIGSPDVSPERSRSWDASVEEDLDNGGGRVTATYFNQRFYDLIQFVQGGPPSYKGSFANLAEAQAKGYELEVELTPPGSLSASASFTHVKPRVTRLARSYAGDLVVGAHLLRRPTQSATATVKLTRRKNVSAVTATYVGERPDIDFNEFPSPTVTLPSYVRLDLSEAVEIWGKADGPTLSLTARVENALDKRYETVLHFPAPGRVILLGARFSGSL